MGALQIILGILGTILLIIFVIWYAYYKRIVRNIDVPMNSPKVYNFCKTKFTDGYSSGTLIREKKNKNGTTLIEYAPDDVEQGDEVKMAEKQSIVVLDDNIIRLSQGSPSTRRQIILITSRNQADFPKQMQKTFEYDFLAKEGQMAYIKETFGKMIPAGDEAIGKLMEEYARGEPASNIIGQIKDDLKKMNELKNLQNKNTEGEGGH